MMLPQNGAYASSLARPRLLADPTLRDMTPEDEIELFNWIQELTQKQMAYLDAISEG
jgi:hypothetical protein